MKNACIIASKSGTLLVSANKLLSNAGQLDLRETLWRACSRLANEDYLPKQCKDELKATKKNNNVNSKQCKDAMTATKKHCKCKTMQRCN